MPHPDLELERARLDFFRQCLDAMRAKTAHLAGREDLLAANEADAVAVRHQLSLRLAALDQPGMLCFGSLLTDSASGAERFHIGRRHLDDAEGEPAVVDWRAPVAVPFYRATAADPLGLDRRQRFTFAADQLADIYEEDFTDPDSLLGGSGAHGVPDPLLGELSRERTGQMRDIVATIQAEQDVVIRAGLDECLIVQGGPGTGKTAVGLHRAAFLLYEQRDQLARTGVLVVGPNPIFLQYISQVLPSLGETSVTQTTLVGIFGWRFRCSIDDSFDRASLLGDARWSVVIERAALRCITVPAESIELRFRSRVVRIEPEFIQELVTLIRDRDSSLRQQRDRFRNRMLREAYDRWSGDELHALSLDEFSSEVLAHKQSRSVLDKCWTTVNPLALVRSLLTSKNSLARSSDGVFDGREQETIIRDRQQLGSQELWSAAEVPLIDHAEAFVTGEVRRYGHVVVDEAQDLSPMALRLIGRRAHRNSLTILGDLAQATGAGASADWSATLAHLGQPDNARIAELTVGYRLPAAILEFANRLLPEAAPLVTPATSARKVGSPPQLVECSTPDIGRVVVARAATMAGEYLTAAVIAPISVHNDLRSAGLVEGEWGNGIVLLDPATAKGLEFDAVIVVDPMAIYREARHGPRLLFVALTRAVQSLTLIHGPEGLPAAFLDVASG